METTDNKRYHFVGIGGVGMSGIAKVMLEQGYKVSGSDIKDSKRLQDLRSIGAVTFEGHRPEHIDCADVVVVSSAISVKNPEVHSAIRRAIPIYHRSEMLSRIMSRGRGIGVAGTHGKTTTAAMVSIMLQGCGQDPTAIVGGDIDLFGANAKLGRGELVVAEADESDGSLIRLNPAIAVVTNIEAEHMDYYPDEESIVDTFKHYLENLPAHGFAVVCLDDPNVERLTRRLPDVDFVTYGIGPNARFRIADLAYDRLGTRFVMLDGDKELGPVQLSVPGRHNALNAAAALSLGAELGLEFHEMAESLREFRGVKRRFQIVGRTDKVMIVDDYAHHPTEIQATLQAAKCPETKRIISIFQPHRYTRTKFFYNQYGRAFFNADEVIVMDVFSAGERPIPNVNGRLVADSLKRNGHRKVRYIPESGEVLSYLERRIRHDDVIITLGAGDVWKVAYGLSERVGGLTEIMAS